MLRRTYEADWERKKNYLIRSLFHDIPDLSTIRESEELSASPPHIAESAFHEDAGPLPDLIVERVPKRRSEDESELFYYGLRKRMRRYYRMLFNKEKDGSSSPDVEDFVNYSTSSNESRYNDEDDIEPELNSAFVEGSGVESTELHNSDASDNTMETYHLEEMPLLSSHVNKSKGNENETDNESITPLNKSTEEKENYGYVETNKSVASNTTFEQNSIENIDPERNISQHSNNQSNSESTSIRSCVLLAHSSEQQESLLETNNQSEQQRESTRSSLNEMSEQNSHQEHVSNKVVEKEIPENSNYLSKIVETKNTVKENNELILNEHCNEANRNKNKEPLNYDSTEVKDISSNANNNDINKQEENELNNKKSDKEKSISKENDTLDAELNSNKMIIDEVEIMRSHNPSPSTQSLEANSSSGSPPNIHLERRGEIVSRFSVLPDRESLGLDIGIATRAMDISETSPEDFHPFLRCSTPISKTRDQHTDRSKSPVLHLNSERKHDLLTTYVVTEYGEENNTAQAAKQITGEIEERGTADLIRTAQNTSTTLKKTKVTRTFEIKEVREVAAQTDNRITEQAKVFVDIGVQVEEKGKSVTSVQVQTDEDEDDVLFGGQRIFRRGSKNYFIFL